MPTPDQISSTLAAARHAALMTNSGDLQLLTFKLDNQEYALNITNVVQVVRMVAVTRAPKAPDFVEGVINLRGRVIPVISLRRRCGLIDKPYDLNTQLLIARVTDARASDAHNNGRMMALMVDVVSEVLSITADCIVPPDEIGADMEHLLAVGKLGDRLILIVDPNSLLGDLAAAALN